jgi:lipoteichoic acid synthase
MIDFTTCLIIFIISNSIKTIYYYMLIGIDSRLMLAHVASTLCITTMVVLFTFSLKRRSWFTAWYLVHSLLYFVNASYFIFFGRLVHLNDVYIFFNEAATLTKNLLIPLNPTDLLFIVDIPLFVYLLSRHDEIKIPAPLLNKMLKITAVACIPALLLLTAIPVQFESDVIRKIDDFDLVSRYGVLGHGIYDVASIFTKRQLESIKYGPVVTLASSTVNRPNIVLIQFESLDAHIINTSYNGRYIAPYLHSLTAKTVYFPFTLCYRSLGGTSDCEIAVNNSIEPLLSYPLIMDRSYTYPNSVVKILKKNGYSSGAFHGITGKFYRRLGAYSAMGYDNFFDPVKMKLPEKGWGVPDREVLDYAAQHLATMSAPFFASIITMSSHEPFNIPHFPHDPRFDSVDPPLTGRYFASVSYTDGVLENFIAKVQQKYPNTYFFIYGDHTPFVIKNGPFQRSALPIANGREIEMVPLFIITPTGQVHYERKSIASYLDIAPTILQAAGVPCKFQSLGINLLDGIPPQHEVVYRGHLYDRSALYAAMTHFLEDME